MHIQLDRLRALGILGLASATAVSCASNVGSTSTGLRNCVEQEATAVGRLACIKRVDPPEGQPKSCSEARRFGGEIVFQPMDEDRRNDLLNEAKYLRHEAWESVANAPFVFEVDWGGALVGAENKNALEWLRGAMLGADATIQLGVSPDTRRLLQLAIHPSGEPIEDFVTDAPAKLIAEAVGDLRKVEGMVGKLREDTHELFSGLYLGLDKLSATTTCYRELGQAEIILQAAVTAFENRIVASRQRLESRHTIKAAEEAEQAKLDREAWAKAKPDACRNVKAAADCEGIDAYLAAFPQGEHAEEAKKILEAVATTLTPLRDDAAWKAAAVEDCKTPKTSNACDGVKAYLEKYPQGRHAEEASTMLKLRKGALVQLAALEDQRRRIAKVREEADCIVACATAMRECQKQCRDGSPEAMAACQKACLATNRETCVPACKK